MPSTGHIKLGDLRQGSVEAGNLVAGAVGATAIGADAITTVKILDDAVTVAKLSENLIQEATVSVTNAEMLALRATPKTLVAAPGAGKVLILDSATIGFLSASGAYTETADNLEIKYTNGSGAGASASIETTGFLDQTTQQYRRVIPTSGTITANAALVLHNNGDGEFGGGHASASTVVKIRYYVVTL